jgi:hypothetical protein
MLVGWKAESIGSIETCWCCDSKIGSGVAIRKSVLSLISSCNPQDQPAWMIRDSTILFKATTVSAANTRKPGSCVCSKSGAKLDCY